jgi:hypothetical protein
MTGDVEKRKGETQRLRDEETERQEISVKL